MRTFINDYLLDPSAAIANARERAYQKFWMDDFSDDKIYEALGSPEFRLYEEIVFTKNSLNASVV